MRCPTCGSKECCGGDYAQEAEYLQPMAECAAIMAVCGYFSRMRGPIGHLVRNALLGSEYFVRGEAYELDDCEIAVPLYAGSAPVPAAQAEAKVADDVGGDEWSAVVRELMATASYRPACQKYVLERCRCFECVNERAVGLLSRNAAMLAAKAKGGGE